MSGTLFGPWAMGGAFRDVAQHTARLFGCPQLQDGAGHVGSKALLRCLQGVDAKNLTLSLMDHVVRITLLPLLRLVADSCLCTLWTFSKLICF